jgi:NTP pyrophosphatase (non-canonical NTP hydrolase)
MIEELIQRAFKLRNQAHSAHWKTKSYAEHKALGHFYEGLIEDLDRLIEAYQGAFGIVGNLEGDAKNIKEEIGNEFLWINENRNKIARDLPALENIVDELAALHLKTIYKLENLR